MGLSRSLYYEWHCIGPIYVDIFFHKGSIHISVKKSPFQFFIIWWHHLFECHLVFDSGVQRRYHEHFLNPLEPYYAYLLHKRSLSSGQKYPPNMDIAFTKLWVLLFYLFYISIFNFIVASLVRNWFLNLLFTICVCQDYSGSANVVRYNFSAPLYVEYQTLAY